MGQRNSNLKDTNYTSALPEITARHCFAAAYTIIGNRHSIKA